MVKKKKGQKADRIHPEGVTLPLNAFKYGAFHWRKIPSL
jgi:hypothetical protein